MEAALKTAIKIQEWRNYCRYLNQVQLRIHIAYSLSFTNDGKPIVIQIIKIGDSQVVGKKLKLVKKASREFENIFDEPIPSSKLGNYLF